MKRNRVAIFGVAVLIVLMVGVPTAVFAHHSNAMFDRDKTITLEGTITDVAWGNPHTLFFLDAKPVDQPNAAVHNWSFTAQSVSGQRRMGWQEDTIKVGDKVRVTGYGRKDGKLHLLFVGITDEKGHQFGSPASDSD